MDDKLIKLERYRKLDNTDTVIKSVIDKFLTRAEIGKKKYGTNLDRNDLDIEEWINHSLEECMDMILYLTKLKQELAKTK